MDAMQIAMAPGKKAAKGEHLTSMVNQAREAEKAELKKKLAASLAGIRGPQSLQMEGPYKSNQGPVSVASAGSAYQAKTVSGPLPEYENMRTKVMSQASSANQSAQDAIKRRFAAMGGLNSGSFIKQAQLQEESNQSQTQEALQGVNAQEAQARRAMQEVEAQKEFQSQEALKGREMAAQESAFSRQDAARSRDFAAEQAILQRNMQREFQNVDQQFKFDVFKFDSESKLSQLDMAWQQMEQDRIDNQFNKEQALYQQKHSGGLFGAGGFLGLGIGIED